ncbi:MAG: TonB-dependent receptor plug domain-containing protein [Rhodothermia bacterium]|nr:TonB-dependent receptor plug domain-containing protein [Rhodothermia bacterium]
MHHVSSYIAAISITVAFLGCASSESTQSGNAADEVEVGIGYGTQSQADISGSVTTISADSVQRTRPASTVAELLRGRVSGVRVTQEGDGLRIQIRGRSSIYGNADPLYVVDDVPIAPGPGGVVSFLNPNDIESITVLKDAASTAIYGSRGANGVILIKTKE